MAYVFLIIKRNSKTEGKPVLANDNLTYRLMQIETEAGKGANLILNTLGYYRCFRYFRGIGSIGS